MIAVCLIIAMCIAEIVCRAHDRTQTRWRACVWWEGSAYLHVAESRTDALEWAACYPNDAHVVIERAFHGTPTIEASRRGISNA